MAKYRKFRKSIRRRGNKRSLRSRSRTRKYSGRFRSENTHSYRLVKSNIGLINVGTSTPATGWLTVDLSTFPNFSNLQALYDQYMVKYVAINFRPAFPALSTTSTNANYDAYFHTILDFDSPTSTTATRSQVLEYRNMRRTTLGRIHRRVYKPKVLGIQYYYDSSGFSAQNLRPVTGWFDIANPATMTNLYYYVDPMQSDAPTDGLTYNVDFTVHLACKNVR